MNLMPLYDHLWQSTVFACVAGLLTLGLRKNRARVRHALWLAASIKFLIPLSVLIALGNQIQWHRVAPSDLSTVVVAVSQPFTMPIGFVPTPAAPVRPAANRLPTILLAVWAIGFLGIGFAWWIRWRKIAAVVHAGSAIPLPLPIPAVASQTLVEPGVFGLVRPTLLLPASIFERLTPEQLNAVIAHELCHVRYRDNLAAAFHMFVETIFWFHPLVWWIGRRMVEERERACDEGVLRMGGEPRVYAEAVLNVCKLYVESPLVCVAGITGADLKRRIEAIMMKRLAQDLHFAKKLGLAFAVTVTLIAPICIGMINSRTVQAQPPKPAPVPAAVMAPAASPTPAIAPKPRPIALPFVAMAPQVVAPATVAPEPQISPTATPEDARRIRREYAKANYPNRVMASAYEAYGPPNRKLLSQFGVQSIETWQYDYLDRYQSNVTIEFASGSVARVTSPPQPKFEGGGQSDDAAAAVLLGALERELQGQTMHAPRLGLIGRHAYVETSLQVNSAEHFINLYVPVDSLSGKIDVIAQVKDQFNSAIANLRDTVDSAAGTLQTSFVALPGSYICSVLVREKASGLTYAESIPFQVPNRKLPR